MNIKMQGMRVLWRLKGKPGVSKVKPISFRVNNLKHIKVYLYYIQYLLLKINLEGKTERC
jgi:hypothetical protein